MNKWLVVLICSISGFFLLGGLGSYAILSSTQGEVLMTGDASESLTFKGEWTQFYDIYAEDKDIEITFVTSETHDPDLTYILRCGVDDDDMIGVSNDCGNLRENYYLVAAFTVEAGGVGDVTLTFDGTGSVMIVQSSVGLAFGSLALMCLGCCLCPLLIIFSGVKLGKGKSQNVIIMNGGQLGNLQPIYQQQPQSFNSYQVPVQDGKSIQVPVQDGESISPLTPQNTFSTFSPAPNANPPTHLQPTQISGGYEWLEYNGGRYYRTQGSYSEWNRFNG
jgi:hypothetical protein